MIDTLARHLAALSEARRLLCLVLANHPQFAEWREACATGRETRADLEAKLSDDPYFKAFMHIEAAQAILRPNEPAGIDAASCPVSLAQRVTLLEQRPDLSIRAAKAAPDQTEGARSVAATGAAAAGHAPAILIDAAVPNARHQTADTGPDNRSVSSQPLAAANVASMLPATARIVNDCLVYSPIEVSEPSAVVRIVRPNRYTTPPDGPQHASKASGGVAGGAKRFGWFSARR